jgi:hypothetical protein
VAVTFCSPIRLNPFRSILLSKYTELSFKVIF